MDHQIACGQLLPARLKLTISWILGFGIGREAEVDLAAEFERYMSDCIRRCKEFGYNAGYWKRMVVDHGAVEASHRLLAGTRASDGFTRLWEEGRLDLSVEFSALLPKYHDLFTGDERAEARRRLEQYGSMWTATWPLGRSPA